MDYSALYYKCQRPELLRHIRAGENRVLDVGCAEGLFGESLKQRGLAKEVIGIELFPDAAKMAETKLDHVICTDLEMVDWSTLNLEPSSFDYVICGDVLEHFRDPWKILAYLTSLLKKNGRLIASIPNVRHWSVVFSLLLKGEWRYQPHGIMDRTHLRFFTRKSSIRLFEECGLKVQFCERSELNRKLDRLMNLLMLGVGKEFVSIQWILVGGRNSDLFGK